MIACRLSPNYLESTPAGSAPDLSAVELAGESTSVGFSGMQIYQNIRYKIIRGVNPKFNSLDIYTPQHAQGLPLMVYVHGGGWSMGDKASSVGSQPQAFTEHGYIYVSINYRLSPSVVHPVHVQDVAAALEWIKENINDYGGDPKRIFLMGHSAGAHLVALVATNETYLNFYGDGLSLIKGVIGLDGGGYDIPLNMQSADALLHNLYTQTFGEDPQTWQDASPYYHLQVGKEIPPFLLVHAGQREISRVEAYEMQETLLSIGVRAELFHAFDKNHGSLNRDLGIPDDETTRIIFGFLESLK